MSACGTLCSNEDLIRIKKLRLIDDDFMSKVFDGNIEATQLVLSIVLEREDINVISVTAQREFKSVAGHSVRFDIFAQDSNGKPYDIEIQRADRGASPQRARYNNALLDSHLLNKGEDYQNLKESYVIFITESDVLGKGFPLYHIERMIQETNELFDDGSHIIFVNGSYNNSENAIGKLMHDFRCTQAKDMYYSELAKKVRYFKETEGGNAAMCKIMEDMRNEQAKDTAIEIAKKMILKGMDKKEVAELTGLSVAEIEKM